MSTQMHCRHCLATKPAEEFYASSKTRCKSCARLCNMAWRLANPEKHKESCREWAKNNREVNRLSANLFYWENRDYCLERDRLRDAREKAIDETAFLEKGRAKHKRVSKALSNAYVAKIMGMHISEAPAQLILAKREQLEIFRMARELKAAVKKE